MKRKWMAFAAFAVLCLAMPVTASAAGQGLTAATQDIQEGAGVWAEADGLAQAGAGDAHSAVLGLTPTSQPENTPTPELAATPTSTPKSIPESMPDPATEPESGDTPDPMSTSIPESMPDPATEPESTDSPSSMPINIPAAAPDPATEPESGDTSELMSTSVPAAALGMTSASAPTATPTSVPTQTSAPAPTTPTPTPDPSYRAEESQNAQGLKVILNPRWEYSKAAKAYKLLKQITAKGAKTYYTLSDGVLQLGQKAGYYYAFDTKGKMITSFKTIKGFRYYFTPKAKAAKDTGSVTPNKTTLGMAVRNQWVKHKNAWWYFNSIGRQVSNKTGLQKINGSYYYLKKSGVPYKSKWIKQSNGAWWYFNKKGKYLSGKVNSRKINGSYYYLDKNGIPYKNCFKTVKSKKYYYEASGKRANYTGWKTIKKKKYYFSEKHYVQVMTGWQVIDGDKYYFSPKGKMYTKKWATIGGVRYYFKGSGKMAVGWAKIGSTYYYFKSSGTLDGSTVAKKGGKYYFVTAEGTRGSNILDGVGVTDAMDNGTKLRVCFNYVVNNCSYLSGVVWPANGWEPYHAYKMLTTHRGNCYDYAAAFCYLAKAVGYEGMICIRGQCAAAAGGLTPHSWCEYNGMVFDPEISREQGYSLFNVTYASLPFAYVK